MLNIGKLRAGGENYYLNSVSKGAEDYYLGSGEAPGYWLASGAKELGLSGEVGDNQLRNVLRASHPTSGNRLTRLRNGKTVPGFDLTFLAPKSVALLHELGSAEVTAKVRAAHDAAVAASLAYLEQQASNGRRGRAGRRSIASEGFIAAAFRHRSSRAGDPLLHTHVLVANLIKGVDGQWGALDAKHLYRHAKTAGYLYQAHLRAELTRRLGVEWTPVHKGSADIEGIARETIEAFSQRSKEIEDVVGERSGATRREREVAALTTRQAKDYRVSPQRMAPQWRAKADRLGLTADALEATMARQQYQSPEAAEVLEIERSLVALDGLTEQDSSFSRREVLQGFCAQLPSGAGIDTVEGMSDAFLGSGEVVPLVPRAPDPGEQDGAGAADGQVKAAAEERRYSTPEMLAVERTVIENALKRRGDGSGIARPAAVTAAKKSRPTLYPDQVEMLEAVARSGNGVDVVVGKAGSGKTYALEAAREAWERSGQRVIGCAVAAKAARQLQTGSGIPSTTLASLLIDLGDPEAGGFTPDTIVVVDEAGMVGTRDLARLLAHADKARAKVVLVGDDRQLPEIPAGGAFRGIKNRMPVVELTQVRRQPPSWEHGALDRLRDGQSRDAIAEYAEHERLHVAKTPEETRAELVSDWWATFNDGEPAVMLVARRSEAAELNDRARALLRGAGLISEQSLDIGGTSFSIGDWIMTRKNNKFLGIDNGTAAVVEGFDRDRGRLTIRCDSGESVTLPRWYLEDGHVMHRYAITAHKAQGMTTERTLVLGDETLYREWGYAAMSRGRRSNDLYVVTGRDPERDAVGGQVARVEDPTEEVIRALGRSRAKHLAIDVYEEDTRERDVAEIERVLEL